MTRPLIATSSLPLCSGCRSLVVIISCSGVVPAWAIPARSFHSAGARNQNAAAAAAISQQDEQDQRPAAAGLLIVLDDRRIADKFLFGRCGRFRNDRRLPFVGDCGASSIAASGLAFRRRRRAISTGSVETAPHGGQPRAARRLGSGAIMSAVSAIAGAVDCRICNRCGGGPPKSMSASLAGSARTSSGSWCQLCLHDAQRTCRPPGGMASSLTTYLVSQAGQVRII